MFFSVCHDPDLDFPNREKLSNGLWLNLDQGWTKETSNSTTLYLKGYSDSGTMEFDHPTQGNYVIIKDDGNSIKLSHDINRGTPLNISNDPLIITNLPDDSLEKIWADCAIELTKNLEIKKTYSEINVDIYKTSRLDAIDRIDQILTQRFTQFIANNKRPIKIFLSGGLDTMLVYSYLKKATNDYELCAYEHLDFSQFYLRKREKLFQYWGYKQIHLWKDPCVLITGACGDEFMLRSPSHLMLFLMHWNIDLNDIIDQSDHHYQYLSGYAEKYKKQKKDTHWIEISKDYQKVCEKVISMNLNDNQHWHLENTLTFTPLKDIEITKILMGLPQEDLISQLKNGDITRELIKRNDPDLLKYLSTQKNKNNQENLWDLYKNLPLD